MNAESIGASAAKADARAAQRKAPETRGEGTFAGTTP